MELDSGSGRNPHVISHIAGSDNPAPEAVSSITAALGSYVLNSSPGITSMSLVLRRAHRWWMASTARPAYECGIMAQGIATTGSHPKQDRDSRDRPKGPKEWDGKMTYGVLH